MEMKRGGEKWGGTKAGRLFELATVPEELLAITEM
jgi:hypothetical protein